MPQTASQGKRFRKKGCARYAPVKGEAIVSV
jgi:hypothetical protein